MSIRNEIIADAKSNEISNAIQYFDAILANDPLAQQSVIRGITSSQLGCAPVTCAGMIDEAFQCANGIEKDIDLYDNKCCPITVSLFKNDVEAVPVPTNGQFTDNSALFTAGECVTITPKRYYLQFRLDSRNCYTCTSQADVIKMMTNALIRGNINAIRKDIFATLTAGAGNAITATGDLLDKLFSLFNSVNDLQIASGKEVILYANKAVITRVMQLRDDNGQPLFQSEGRCPITDCISICYAGMRIKEVDQKVLPIVAGQSDVFAVVAQNIKGSYSEVQVYTKDWTTTLQDTDDVIHAEVCVGSVIPAQLTGSAKRLTVTL
jgi:hypothetical protein